MDWKKLLIFAAVLVYVISPVDLMPGSPIDDILIVLLTFITQRRALKRPKDNDVIDVEE